MGYNSGRSGQGYRSFDRGSRPDIKPPVNVGDILDVRIEAVGEKGDGIAKQKGFVLFVPNTQEGQIVKIKVTKVLSKVGFAEVVGEGDAANLAKAPERAQPQKEEEAPQAEQEPAPEDTENFGEEAEAPKYEEEVSSPEEPEPDAGEEDLGEEDEKVPKPDE